jgi:hypothetical protein
MCILDNLKYDTIILRHESISVCIPSGINNPVRSDTMVYRGRRKHRHVGWNIRIGISG